MIAEELSIIIDAKVTQAVRDLKKVDKSTSKLTDTFKKMAGPLAIGAVVLATIRMGKEFSKAASDAEEIGSKYKTVFRDIETGANDAFQTLADKFDLADSTAQKLIGDTGDLLTGFGFTQDAALSLAEQVNTLAIDLASFTNFTGGAEGASAALNKALVGEAESVKALGIVIRQDTKEYQNLLTTLQETKGVSLLQAKALAALQIATEQSKNAIGDYERTADSTANTFRRLEQSTLSLKEEMGVSINRGITPMAAATATLVKQLADWISKSNEAVQLQKEINDGTEITIRDIGVLTEAYDRQVDKLGILIQQQKTSGEAEAFESRIASARVNLALLKDQKDLEVERLFRSKEYAELEKDLGSQRAIATVNANIAAEADLAAKEIAIGRQEALIDAYAQTEAGQIVAIQNSIAFFETFEPRGPKATAILAMLNKELVNFTEKSIEANQSAIDFYASEDEASHKMVENVMVEIDTIKELNETYKNLASDGLGSFARAFKEVGEGSISVWEGIKQGSKDAMSAILEGLALEATSRAAIALFSGNFVSAAGFTAAATAAYAASGVVQGFGNGTDFTTTGPKLIMVGERGKERVRVDPQPDGRSGNGGNIINIYGDIVGAGGKEEFIQEVIDGINGVQRTRTA